MSLASEDVDSFKKNILAQFPVSPQVLKKFLSASQGFVAWLIVRLVVLIYINNIVITE